MDESHNLCNLVLAPHSVYSSQLRTQPVERFRVSFRLIGACRPVVTYLLFHRRSLCWSFGRGVKYGVVTGGVVPQRSFSEAAPENFVSRYRVLFDPAAARVLI